MLMKKKQIQNLSTLIVSLFIISCSSVSFNTSSNDKRLTQLTMESHIEKENESINPAIRFSENPKKDNLILSKKKNYQAASEKNKNNKAKKDNINKEPSKKAIAKEKSYKKDKKTTRKSRRPPVDPFVIGEKNILDIFYYKTKVGRITLEVRPFKAIQGRRAYHFVVTIKFVPPLSYLYSVNIVSEAYMDYEDIVPLLLETITRKKKSLKKSNISFNWNELKAKYSREQIKKNQTEGKIIAEKTWQVPPFSQSIISSFYYLRTLKLEPNKSISLSIANNGKNIPIEIDILREEQLTTKSGRLNTIVVKLNTNNRKELKARGNVLIWFTNDNKKQIVKINLNVKYGHFVIKAK